MGICLVQWRAAVGRWANFSHSRPTLVFSPGQAHTGYWCFSLFNYLILHCFGFLMSYKLVTLITLLIISGTVHVNPGPNNHYKELRISHVNMRSLCPTNPNKLEDLHSTLCIDKHFDLIGVTETWLDNNICDKDISLPDYQVFRTDRDRNGGGVALYITDALPAKRLHDFDTFNLELVALETMISNKRIIVLCCYRPPGKRKQDIDHFLVNFENVISLLLHLNPSCFVIMGDFNDRCLVWEDSHAQSDLKRKFYDLVRRFHLFQIINEPTHLSETTQSLLDLIITDAPAYIDNSGVGVPIGDPYHCFVFCQLTIKYCKDKCYNREVWNYKRADFNGLNIALDNAPWNVLEIFDDVNEATDYFTKLLLDTAKEFIPFNVVKIDPRDKPWMTTQVKHAFRLRDKLHKKWKKSKSKDNWDSYRESRHHANFVKSVAKMHHYNRVGTKLSDPSTNAKEYWHLVKSLYGSKIDAGIPPLNSDDNVIADAKGKADLLNQHFASKSTLPPVNERPSLPRNIYESASQLSEVSVTEKDILDSLKTMKTASANGPDNISNRLLKETITSILSPLKTLFNLSLRTQVFPAKWKEANVTPVFKGGERQDKQNYRPISLLSNVGKLLERIIFKKLYEYCMANGLLTWRNSGYKRMDSTVNQMIYISHKIYEALSKGEEVCFVSLDATAAFDSVWHDGLIHKLKNKGITGKLLAWLTDYLTGRKQRVVIKGQASTWHSNTAGVPQGSI